MLHHFWVEIYESGIGFGHATFVLGQEIRHERREGMELHCGYKFHIRILLAYGIDGSAKLGGRVGEVFVSYAVGQALYELKTVACTMEVLNSFEELLAGDTNLLASKHSRMHVLHVVLTKHTHL